MLAGYGFRPYIINQSGPTSMIMFTVKQMGVPYGTEPLLRMAAEGSTAQQAKTISKCGRTI